MTQAHRVVPFGFADGQQRFAPDWAPHPTEGDKILYLFDCGELGDEQSVILQSSELDRWEWVGLDRIDDYVVPRLARRVRQAHIAHVEESTRYLEHGVPTP
ncbi:hypothetical protein [Nocardia amikacinitolerans]|uniref:hypothetical protein n=1 Tax=Nocardia amikacinitolerans TaxID=756689 RepID=UPI0020A56CB1|nr:hypothetical protein [Nocardia amikacinitolerans]